MCKQIISVYTKGMSTSMHSSRVYVQNRLKSWFDDSIALDVERAIYNYAYHQPSLIVETVKEVFDAIYASILLV